MKTILESISPIKLFQLLAILCIALIFAINSLADVNWLYILTGDDAVDDPFLEAMERNADNYNKNFPDREQISVSRVRSVEGAKIEAAYNNSVGESTYVIAHGSLDPDKSGTIYTADGGDRERKNPEDGRILDNDKNISDTNYCGKEPGKEGNMAESFQEVYKESVRKSKEKGEKDT